MEVLKNNNGYYINFYNDEMYEQIDNILKCFLIKDYKLIFEISEELFKFTKSERCKNSKMFFFDAESFIEDRTIFDIKESIFQVGTISRKIKTIWFGVDNIEDIKKATCIEHLFTVAVIKKSDKYKNHYYLLKLVETIDNYRLFITVKNNDEFINNVFPKLQQYLN